MIVGTYEAPFLRGRFDPLVGQFNEEHYRLLVTDQAPWIGHAAQHRGWPEFESENPAAAEGLLAAIRRWNELGIERADLGGADLRHVYLPGVLLNTAILEFTDLAHARLAGASLARAKLHGARLFGADLARVSAHGADFNRAELSKASLSEAHLSHSLLDHARLDDAILDHTQLVGARLVGAHLSEAVLLSVRLEHANLTDANLSYSRITDSDFSDATLSNAQLRWSNLRRSSFRRARAENADFRDVQGLQLDETFVRQARFDPAASDPWSELRRTYTGPRLLFHLLLLSTFLAPILLQATVWHAIGAAQIAAGESVAGAIMAEIGRSGAWREERVWHLALHLHSTDRWLVLVTVLLLIYNVIRGVLTFFVPAMRDAEERSGYSPAWINETPRKWRLLNKLHSKKPIVNPDDAPSEVERSPPTTFVLGIAERWRNESLSYRTFFRLHSVAWPVLYLALAVTIVRAWSWINLSVRVP